jgi:hypothetical protein
VHLFSDVGAGIIDDDGLGGGGLGDVQTAGEVVSGGDQARLDKVRVESDVDKAGAGDGGVANVGEFKPFNDLFGNCSGIGFAAGALGQGLGQTHGGVGLVVPEPVILRDGEERVGVEVEGGADGVADDEVELGGDGGHG